MSSVNEPVLVAMHALFAALGEPTRRPLSETEDENPSGRVYEGVHPVFMLAETFPPNDAGYTGNIGRRGQHYSLPCFTEAGEVVIIETTFHKGETFVERLEFPRTPTPVFDALYALLEQSEIRD